MVISSMQRLMCTILGQPLTWTKLKQLNHCKRILQRVAVSCKKDMSSNHSVKPPITSSFENPAEWKHKFEAPEPQYDWDFLCDESKTLEIQQNIANRKGIGDIHKVIKLWKKMQGEMKPEKKSALKEELMAAAAELPNMSSPFSPIGDEGQAKLIETVGTKKEFSFKPQLAVDLGEKLNLLRAKNVFLGTGPKTYYFQAELAQLEEALIKYAVQKLKGRGFDFVTVPDMLHPVIIKGCGFQTSGARTQVYTLDPDHFGELCMIGTAELPLAGYFVNEVLQSQNLPKRLCAVSRCYRAETSNIEEEQGIYRVHQFSKVEMFGITSSEEEGNSLLEEYLGIEKEIFSELGLHFRILEMPTQELGAPAYRKLDIEAWMHGKQMWGEISSASNCTDYQSRKLNIRCCNQNGQQRFATTVNGTACAVPRLIMAIFEQFQQQDGTVKIPSVLQPYMGGQDKLTKSKLMPDVKWITPVKFK